MTNSGSVPGADIRRPVAEAGEHAGAPATPLDGERHEEQGQHVVEQEHRLRVGRLARQCNEQLQNERMFVRILRPLKTLSNDRNVSNLVLSYDPRHPASNQAFGILVICNGSSFVNRRMLRWEM